jgi:hypothetical protein
MEDKSYLNDSELLDVIESGKRAESAFRAKMARYDAAERDIKNAMALFFVSLMFVHIWGLGPWFVILFFGYLSQECSKVLFQYHKIQLISDSTLALYFVLWLLSLFSLIEIFASQMRY